MNRLYRLIAATGIGILLSQPVAAQTEPMSIQDFVRQVFIHGVPFDAARAYDASAVPTLLEMLADPAEEAHRANIVVVLGIIGDPRATQPMISFIEADGTATLAPAQYRAKTAALMALGYLINRSGNEQALNYLIAGLEPPTWRDRGPAGIAPFQASAAERNRDFSKYSMLGLALSGHPRAGEALRAVRQAVPGAPRSALVVEGGDLVGEALRAHEEIASEGLAAYYEDAEP